MTPRPLHTGIHQWGPPDDGLRYCEVCGWSEFSITGHSCAGIRGILGRVTEDQDLTGRGVADPSSRPAETPGPLLDRVPCQPAPRPVKNRRRSISPASPAQRLKVRELACLVCGKDRHEAPIDPAHVIARAQLSEDQDEPLAVVPLCRQHHQEFDRGALNLLPYLEPAYSGELGEAVRRFGLLPTLRRVTGERWTPERQAA